jgi:uncharacterized protein
VIITVVIDSLHFDEQLAALKAVLARNAVLTDVLERAAAMDLRDWYVAAGCLCQTVWNVTTGRPPDSGIKDYDLVYFDGGDLSWEAEDRTIKKGREMFAGVPVEVEVRNEARVHLWYAEKFGVPCVPYQSTESAIDTFPATSSCLGIRLEPGGHWRVYAPYGLADVFDLVIRPNPIRWSGHRSRSMRPRSNAGQDNGPSSWSSGDGRHVILT